MTTLLALPGDLEAVEESEGLLHPPWRSVDERVEDPVAVGLAPRDQMALAEALDGHRVARAEPEARRAALEPALLRLVEPAVLEHEQQPAIGSVARPQSRARHAVRIWTVLGELEGAERDLVAELDARETERIDAPGPRIGEADPALAIVDHRHRPEPQRGHHGLQLRATPAGQAVADGDVQV